MSEPLVLPCPDPQFTYDHRCGVWGACTRCGRFAWYHEQASPIDDLKALIAAIRAGRVDESTLPPVMLSPEQVLARAAQRAG